MFDAVIDAATWAACYCWASAIWLYRTMSPADSVAVYDADWPSAKLDDGVVLIGAAKVLEAAPV